MRLFVIFFGLSILIFACKKEKIDSPSIMPTNNLAVTSGVGLINAFWTRNSDGTIPKLDERIKLRVNFLGPIEIQKRALVKKYVREWEHHAYVEFVFVTDEHPAEIRVSFIENYSWSVIGQKALNISLEKPTLNIEQALESSDTSFYEAVLHEFGHVLGLLHEHLHPLANINWNKEAIYADFLADGIKVIKDEIDKNYFIKCDRNTAFYNKYDVKSIMHYPIYASKIKTGNIVAQPTEISNCDKTLIGRIYPYPKAKNDKPKNEFFCLNN